MYGSDHLGLVKVSDDDISNHMDESAIWGKIALTTFQTAFGFALCDIPVAVLFIPKSHSHSCDYLN